MLNLAYQKYFWISEFFSIHKILLHLILLIDSKINMLGSMQHLNQSSSNTSSDIQVRYQKAVREISKLVNVNATMKRDFDNSRAIIEQIETENLRLRKELDELINQLRLREQQQGNLAHENAMLRSQLAKLQKQFQQCRQGKTLQNNLDRLNRSQEVRERLEVELADNKDMSFKLRKKLDHQGQQIIQLEEKLGERNHQNQILQNKFKQLAEKYEKIQCHKIKVLNPHNKTIETQTLKSKCDHLMAEVKNMRDWCATVNEENVQLKKQLALTASEKMVYPKPRGSIFYVEQMYSNQMRELRTQSTEKYLKQQKNLKKRQNHVDKLVYQNNLLKNKIKKLQKLIDKLQAYAEAYELDVSAIDKNPKNQRINIQC